LRERTSDTENPWNFSGAGTNETGRPWSSGLVTAGADSRHTQTAMQNSLDESNAKGSREKKGKRPGR